MTRTTFVAIGHPFPGPKSEAVIEEISLHILQVPVHSAF